jgi:hypothetical protein
MEHRPLASLITMREDVQLPPPLPASYLLIALNIRRAPSLIDSSVFGAAFNAAS